jgi:hypothetical protein
MSERSVKDTLKIFREFSGDGDFTLNIQKAGKNEKYFRGLFSDDREIRLNTFIDLLKYALGNVGYVLDAKEYCRQHHQKQPDLCVKESTLIDIHKHLSKLIVDLEQMNDEIRRV